MNKPKLKKWNLIWRRYPRLLLVVNFVLLAACADPGPQSPPAVEGNVSSTVTSAPRPAQTSESNGEVAATAPPPLVSTPTVATQVGPTATQAPDPTTAIPGLIGPFDFPSNVNPLTGMVVEDPSKLDRRPLAIKISNYPAVVRPQSGLNSADLVFEHYAEGGVTRFTALFYANDADPVGSIRSARLIDLEIPKMYDAAFAYSGSSGPVRLMLRDSEFFDRIISPDFAHGGFYRIEDPNKAVEHTLFTDTNRLRAILEERGLNRPPQFQSNMAFLADIPTGGSPASSIEIRYVGTNAFWRYDPITGGYMRSTDGVAHLDASTGHQLNFKNVVVVGAHHEDTDILEDLVGGGHYSIQIQVWGEGPVSIFRDGQRFEGRWRRENPRDMLTFYDAEGNIMPLAPGKTFFEMVPLGFNGLIVTE